MEELKYIDGVSSGEDSDDSQNKEHQNILFFFIWQKNSQTIKKYCRKQQVLKIITRSFLVFHILTFE